MATLEDGRLHNVAGLRQQSEEFLHYQDAVNSFNDPYQSALQADMSGAK